MADGFAALTDDMRAKFHDTQSRLGLRSDQLAHEGVLRAADFGGKLVLSGDATESHVPPTVVPVATMAELNTFAGVPDEHYASGRFSDKHIAYPEAPAPERVSALAAPAGAPDDPLTPDELDALLKASRLYLTGDSAQLEAFEPLLNRHMMPGTVAVFAGESIVVGPGETVTIKPGKAAAVALNYGTITIHDGGQLVAGDVPVLKITAQIFATGV